MKHLRRSLALALVLGSAALVAGCAGVLSGRHPVGNAAVPQPAKSVELSRYLGRWYEIARYEQGFQKDCDGVTADYALRADGGIDVLNRCRKPDGTVKDARGKAKIVDPVTNAKLKVSFFGPFYGDYWVLDHADDYSWSIVGEGSGRYLWLLTREAVPPQATTAGLIARAGQLGYDTSMLRMTLQP
jgi:apolipoprotein D and lipocalin family protein